MEVLYLLAASAIVLAAISLGDAQIGIPFCNFGHEGRCGPYNNFRCPRGTRCRRAAFSTSGLCCRLTGPPPNGVCPPPSSGLMTECLFDRNRNCLTDSDCPRKYMCCSDGCGMVCKHRRTGATYPGPLPGTVM